MRALTLLFMTLLGCVSPRVSSPEVPSYARTALGGEPDVVFAVDIARLRAALAEHRASVAYPGALQLLGSASQIDLMMQMRSQAEPWVVAVAHGRFGEAAVPLAWLAEHLGGEQLRRLGPASVEARARHGSVRVRVFEKALVFTRTEGEERPSPSAADLSSRVPIADEHLAVFALGPGFFRWASQHPGLERQRPLHRDLRRASGWLSAAPAPRATITLEFDSSESAARAELHWRKWLAQSRSLTAWHAEPSVLATRMTRDGSQLSLELALGADLFTESPRGGLAWEAEQPEGRVAASTSSAPTPTYPSPCGRGLRLDLETRRCVTTP